MAAERAVAEIVFQLFRQKIISLRPYCSRPRRLCAHFTRRDFAEMERRAEHDSPADLSRNGARGN